MKLLFLIPLLLVSCANVASSRFEFIDAQGVKTAIEVPKEVDAKNLVVTFDTKTGVFTLTAASWASRNVETIEAQGKRESVISGAISEGLAIGAIKGLKGMP